MSDTKSTQTQTTPKKEEPTVKPGQKATSTSSGQQTKLQEPTVKP